MTSRTKLAVAVIGLAAMLVTVPGAASAAPIRVRVRDRGLRSATGFFPDTIDLPTGFQPEGIAIGRLPFAYFGSLADGSIYRVNLVTGRGRIISEGPGTPSVGVKLDARGRLFVAGGRAGNGRVVDTRTGEVLASYAFAAAPRSSTTSC